jgi:flagellar hook protein FlgE
MNSSFYTAISGIKSDQYAMDVIADNISNVNTVGFKSSTAEFSSLFASTLSGSYTDPTVNNIGLGTQSQTTALNLSQGSLQTTDGVFDLALDGEGWFGVIGADGNTYYTRSGDFTADANGNLVNGSGYYLSGTLGNNISLYETTTKYVGSDSSSSQSVYAITQIDDISLTSPEQQEIINLPTFLYFPAEATTYVNYNANLDPEIEEGLVDIDIEDADFSFTTDDSTETMDITGNIATTSGILDAQDGDTVIVTVTNSNGTYVDTTTTIDANGNWSLSDYDISKLYTTDNTTGITSLGDVTVSAILRTEQEIANEEHFSAEIISPEGDRQTLDLTFVKEIPQGTDGSVWNVTVNILDGVTSSASIIATTTGTLGFNSLGQLTSNTLSTIDNGGTTLSLGFGELNSFDGMTAIVGSDSTTSVDKDGYVAGELTEYGMDSNGNVVAEFTNGRTAPIAKIAVYHFQNDQGLSSIGSNMYSVTSNSGNPIFYADENGNTFLGAQIYSSMLESSNVDLSVALTELIVMQRAFEASGSCITTSDEMIQNAINMKE